MPFFACHGQAGARTNSLHLNRWIVYLEIAQPSEIEYIIFLLAFLNKFIWSFKFDFALDKSQSKLGNLLEYMSSINSFHGKMIYYSKSEYLRTLKYGKLHQ